jgi:hypothetical protein
MVMCCVLFFYLYTFSSLFIQFPRHIPTNRFDELHIGEQLRRRLRRIRRWRRVRRWEVKRITWTLLRPLMCLYFLLAIFPSLVAVWFYAINFTSHFI